jgi:hypothetical protein
MTAMIRAYNPAIACAIGRAAMLVETDFAIWIDCARSGRRVIVRRRVGEG